MFARAWRIVFRVAAVLLLTAALMKLFGSIHFSPNATDLLVHVAGRFGIYGVENIEDFYVAVTMALSLVIAAMVVYSIERIGRRRSPPLRAG